MNIMNQVITVGMIRSWRPCYDPSEIVNEGWKGTVGDIIATNLIPASDKLWLLLRDDLLPAEIIGSFARQVALDVVHLWNAPPIVLEFLHTGDETLREAAGRAAWDAAGATAEWAAGAVREEQVKLLAKLIKEYDNH